MQTRLDYSKAAPGSVQAMYKLQKYVDASPVRFQPMAADNVASAVGRVAMGSPLNGIVEVAGPEQFRFDELIRLGLSARKDPREVIADPS